MKIQKALRKISKIQILTEKMQQFIEVWGPCVLANVWKNLENLLKIVVKSYYFYPEIFHENLQFFSFSQDLIVFSGASG